MTLLSNFSVNYPFWLQQTANSKSWIYISLFFGQMCRERDASQTFTERGFCHVMIVSLTRAPFIRLRVQVRPMISALSPHNSVSVTVSRGIFCNCCCMYWGFNYKLDLYRSWSSRHFVVIQCVPGKARVPSRVVFLPAKKISELEHHTLYWCVSVSLKHKTY